MKDQSKKIKDYEQKRTELNEKLKENYFIFSEFVKKGNINIKQSKKKKGNANNDFESSSQQYFYNSRKHAFFEEPEFQTEFFNQLGQSMSQKIKPNLKTSLYSDQMSKRIQSLMVLKNDPDSVKSKLISFFKRRLAQLEMKKKKTIVRYSNFVRGPSSSTKCDKYLLSRVNLIDQEIIHLEKRIERLKLDDSFTESLTNYKQRPIAVNEKGSQIYRILEDDEMCFSNICREDFEVYLRSTLFDNRIKRDLWKFYYEVKWIHYFNKFNILEEVNNQLNQTRIKHQLDWTSYYNQIIHYIEKRIVDKYPASQNEMKQAAFKLFDQNINQTIYLKKYKFILNVNINFLLEGEIKQQIILRYIEILKVMFEERKKKSINRKKFYFKQEIILNQLYHLRRRFFNISDCQYKKRIIELSLFIFFCKLIWIQ